MTPSEDVDTALGSPSPKQIPGMMFHLSKWFNLEKEVLTELSYGELHRARDNYQPSKNIVVRGYSEATGLAGHDATQGIGTSERKITNALEESGGMSNEQRCLYVDQLTNEICGKSVPAGLRAILDHLKSHGICGWEKKVVECRWAEDFKGACGKTFQRRNASRHMAAHLHLRFYCDHCYKNFARGDLLKDHVRDEHQD